MGLYKNKKSKGEQNPKAAGTPVNEGAAAACEVGAADDELIAVIAAAISAYEANQYRQTLYIRKLDRTAAIRPAWNVMGMNEAIDTRRM